MVAFLMFGGAAAAFMHLSFTSTDEDAPFRLCGCGGPTAEMQEKSHARDVIMQEMSSPQAPIDATIVQSAVAATPDTHLQAARSASASEVMTMYVERRYKYRRAMMMIHCFIMFKSLSQLS